MLGGRGAVLGRGDHDAAALQRTLLGSNAAGSGSPSSRSQATDTHRAVRAAAAREGGVRVGSLDVLAASALRHGASGACVVPAGSSLLPPTDGTLLQVPLPLVPLLEYGFTYLPALTVRRAPLPPPGRCGCRPTARLPRAPLAVAPQAMSAACARAGAAGST
jgi:hypothetical protein